MWTRTLLFGVFTLYCIVAVTLSEVVTTASDEVVEVGTEATDNTDTTGQSLEDTTIAGEPAESTDVANQVTSATVEAETGRNVEDLEIALGTSVTGNDQQEAVTESKLVPTLPPGEKTVEGKCEGDLNECKRTTPPSTDTTIGITGGPGGVSVTQSKVEPGTLTTNPTDSQRESTKSPLDGEATTVEEQEITTISLITTTLRTWPADDPCYVDNYKVMSNPRRHFTKKAQKVTEPLTDAELITGWYGFDYFDQPAVITTSCIKENQCSTIMPYYYKEMADTPEIGEQIDNGTICGPGSVAGEVNCCLKPIRIKIRNCQTRLIYYLQKLELALSSICIQLPDEVVDAMYLAIEPKTTTAVPTTPRPTLPWVVYQSGEDKGIVTIEYKFPQAKQDTNFLIESFDGKFRTMIAESLNSVMLTHKPKMPSVPDVDPDADPSGPEDTRKRRETQTHKYTSDEVKYIGITPTATGETLQVPIYVEDSESGRVPTALMMDALKHAESSEAISNDVDLTMERYYAGLPDGLSLVEPLSGTGTWARHRDLLIALIVLISLCLLIIFIGLCCLKCRKNRGSWSRADDKVFIEDGNGAPHTKKRLMVAENPMPDSEIMRDEGPMVEHDNPAMTSNGGGGHLSKKDDDNGWIVPIDELSKAEKERPEVEDTKL